MSHTPAVNRETGVVVALCAEAHALWAETLPTDTICRRGALLIYICGMGADNAQAATQALLDAGCRRLISWGTAGALDKRLKSGDLLLPVQIVNDTGDVFNTDPSWQATLQSLLDCPTESGTLLSSPAVLSTTEQKQQAHNSTQALAVDMESAEIARLAAQHSCPLLVIRAIVDEAEMQIPSFSLETIDDYGRSLPAKTLAAIIRHPGSLPTLIRLGRAFKQALSTLQQIAPHLIKQAENHASSV